MSDRADRTAMEAGSPAQLGASIRARRRVLHLTQTELAALAEVSVRYVHDLESGKPTVRLAQLLLVLDALGLRLTLRTATPDARE